MIYRNVNGGKCFLINCSCGCGDEIEIRVYPDKEYGDVSINIVASKWYAEQCGVFGQIKKKLRKIWWVIRGKDYYHCDLILKKDQWTEFAKLVNEIRLE